MGQSRDADRWWADQHGTAYSDHEVESACESGSIEYVLWDEDEGVLVCRDAETGDLHHLVRIPSPDASEAAQAAFYERWDAQGYPPRRQTG
jgi:hypothetical protein